jgi:hypothetical protein
MSPISAMPALIASAGLRRLYQPQRVCPRAVRSLLPPVLLPFPQLRCSSRLVEDVPIVINLATSGIHVRS